MHRAYLDPIWAALETFEQKNNDRSVRILEVQGAERTPKKKYLAAEEDSMSGLGILLVRAGTKIKYCRRCTFFFLGARIDVIV